MSKKNKKNVKVESQVAVEAAQSVEAADAQVEQQVTEQVVDAIVPAEAQAEVAAAGEALSFKNVKEAAAFLIQRATESGKELKETCAVDSIYKVLKGKLKKTHGFTVARNEDKSVTLTSIA